MREAKVFCVRKEEALRRNERMRQAKVFCVRKQDALRRNERMLEAKVFCVRKKDADRIVCQRRSGYRRRRGARRWCLGVIGRASWEWVIPKIS